jgi:hypothetical protein
MAAQSGLSLRVSYGRIIYAPTQTFHSPNPPITIKTAIPLNDSVNESAAITESQTATAVLNDTISESAAITDTVTGGLIVSDQVDETMAASDSQDATTAFSDSVAESASISDSQDATIIPLPPIPPIPPLILPITCPVAIDCSKPGMGGVAGDVNDPDFPITNYSSEGPEQVPEYHSVVFPDFWDKMGCLSLCTSNISQNAADLCALAQAAQCNPVVPQCPPNCGPPGTPVTNLFFNQATTCSCVCDGGSEFFYTVPAGIFIGSTQAIANALANAFCHTRCFTACAPVPPGGNPSGAFRIGSIPSGCLGTPYSQTVPSTRFVLLWVITAGVLPDGLQLNATTGLISGTPTTAGSSVFQIRAYNEDGNYAQRNYDLCIVDISPAVLPDAEIGVAYSQILTATACAPGTLSWQVTSGFLPAGLTLNPLTGEISGTPTLDAAYNFSVSVSSTTFSCSKAYTLTVAPCANITTASPLPNATENVAYNEQLTSIGITNPTWSIIAGALPTGLNMSTGGLISGTPTVSGPFNFTVQVSGDEGTCGKAFSLTVTVATDCPDWSALVWGPPTIFTEGSGAGALVFAGGDTVIMNCQSPLTGANEDASVDVDGTVTYNGPGCNCNLHIQLVFNGNPGVGDVGANVLITSDETGFIFLVDAAALGNGTFDVPFTIPDTVGIDFHLHVHPAVSCGPNNAPNSSMAMSCIISNVP